MNVALRVGSTVLDVEIDDQGAGAWLTEFFTPWADIVPFGHGDRRVRMTHSDAAFTSLERRRASAATRAVPCYRLDSGVLHLPGWDDGRAVVAADDDLGCFVRAEGTTVDVTARPWRVRTRLGLMRVVRELLSAPVLEADGEIDVHAAAFSAGGRAVLIAGRKSSGKTTMLAHALASAGARLLANDRVALSGGRTPVVATGIPTLVTIRPWTLELYPGLRLTAAERPSSLCVGEPVPETAAAEYSAAQPREFAVSPAQFARRLGVGLARSAPVAAVLFPVLSRQTDTWSFEPLPPDEAARRLRECLYGSADGSVRTVFESADRPGTGLAQAEAAIERLTTTALLAQATLGPGAYRDGARAWLKALGLDGASQGQSS